MKNAKVMVKYILWMAFFVFLYILANKIVSDIALLISNGGEPILRSLLGLHG